MIESCLPELSAIFKSFITAYNLYQKHINENNLSTNQIW